MPIHSGGRRGSLIRLVKHPQRDALQRMKEAPGALPPRQFAWLTIVELEDPTARSAARSTVGWAALSQSQDMHIDAGDSRPRDPYFLSALKPAEDPEDRRSPGEVLI
jgi:hypothetical protein